MLLTVVETLRLLVLDVLEKVYFKRTAAPPDCDRQIIVVALA